MKKEFTIEFTGDIHIEGNDKKIIENYFKNAVFEKYKNYGDFYAPREFKEELEVISLFKISNLNFIDEIVIKCENHIQIKCRY